MSHLQFEEWLFNEDELKPKQREALTSHLASCQSCMQLASAWKDVTGTLSNPKFVLPEPGFVIRWEQKLEAGEDRRKSWRGWIFTVLFITLAAGLWLLPAVSSFPAPADLITQILDSVSSSLAIFGAASSLLESLAQTLPDIAFPLFLAFVNIASILLIIIWVYAYQRITLTQGVY